MSKKQKQKNKKDKSASSIKKTPKFLSTLRHSSKSAWAIIGVVAVVLGLFFNIFLDFPQLVSNWIGNPTPLPIAKAEIENGEILVVVTKFTGESGEAATTRIFRALSDRVQLAELSDVRIELLLSESPRIREDAIRLGNIFNATLVIWGTADQYGIEPRYEVVRNEILIPIRPDLGTTIAHDLPTFNAYVVNGIPNEFEYLMLFSVGQLYLINQKPDKAIPLLVQATQIEVGDKGKQLDLKTAYYYLGKAHGISNDYKAAIIDFSNAILLDPKFVGAYNDRGYSYEKIGDQNLAVSDYLKALDIDPNMSSAHMNLGWIYHNRGEYDKALLEYSRSIELDPTYDQSYLLRGNIFFEQKNYQAAVDDYTKAIALNPNFGLTYKNRGGAYLQVHEFQKAIDDFEMALKLNPDLHDSYRGLGEAYFYIREFQKSIDYLTEFIKAENSQDPDVYYMRGLAYEGIGSIEQALSDYEMCLRLLPEDSGDRNFLLKHMEEIKK